MDDYRKSVGSAQTPPLYSGDAEQSGEPRQADAFNRTASVATPQTNMGDLQRPESFKPTRLSDRQTTKLKLGQSIKLKLLWLGQKVLSGRARGWVTNQALKLLDDAYKKQKPQVAVKVKEFIVQHQLPMDSEQMASYKQLNERLFPTRFELPTHRQGTPSEALQQLSDWFVESSLHAFLPTPLHSLAQIENTTENALISQYALALMDVLDGDHQESVSLQDQHAILQSMQQTFPQNPELARTLRRVESMISTDPA